jgi:hypothetical protein
MSQMKVYDMSRYQRIVGVESDRISGKFYILRSDEESAWVHSLDVTVWGDETRRFGRLLYSGDLSAQVKGGAARLSKHMVASDKLADVEDVWDEMLTVLVAVAEVFPKPVTEGTTP